MTHKFCLNQAVVCSPSRGDIYNIPVRGKITRLLPKDGLEYHYHVEFAPDGQLRMAQESQLRIISPDLVRVDAPVRPDQSHDPT